MGINYATNQSKRKNGKHEKAYYYGTSCGSMLNSFKLYFPRIRRLLLIKFQDFVFRCKVFISDK